MESISLVPNTVLNSLYVNERKNCTGGSIVLEDRYTDYFMQVTDTTAVSIDRSLLSIPANCSVRFKLIVWSSKANVLNFSGCSIEQIEVQRGESTFTIEWTSGSNIWTVIPEVLSGYTEIPLMAYALPETVKSLVKTYKIRITDNSWIRYFNVFNLLQPYQKNNDNWIYGQCEYSQNYSTTIWSAKPFMLTKLQFHWTNNYSAEYFPKTVSVYGSNDNTNWMPIISNAVLTFSAGVVQDLLVTGTNTFFRTFKFEFTQDANSVTCLPPISILGYEGTLIDNYRYSYLVPSINAASNGYNLTVNSSDMSSTDGNPYSLLYNNGDAYTMGRSNTSVNFEYTFTLPSAQSICGIFFRNDTALDCCPTLLTVSGSNNGTDWTEISRLMGYAFYENPGKMEECPYLFGETEAYSYYKVTVINTNNGSNAYCKFNQLNLIKKTISTKGFETIIPRMSSNSQDGYVVSASNTAEGNVYNMFDGNAGYFHVGTFSDGEWIVHIQLPQATVIKGICMYDRPDSYYGQAPYAFTVQGSNNDEDWTVLSTVNAGSQYWTSSYQLGIFGFNNSTAYTYYRVVCTASNGGSYCGIAELGLMTDPYLPSVDWYEDEYMVPVMNSDSQDGYIASASSYWPQGNPFYAFDRDIGVSNKWLTASGATVSGSWIKIQLPTAEAVSIFQIIAPDESGQQSRVPTAFKIQGSNDDSTWSDLVDVSGISWNSAETKSWNNTSTTAYLYYRILISANGGDGLVAIGEWNLIKRIFHDN